MPDPTPRPGSTVPPAKTLVGADEDSATTQAGLLPPPPSTAERPLPRVVGYDLLAEVGRGGMGVVYKALHLRLKRVVALKVLSPAPGLSPDDWRELQARFRREAEALARLKHPHIVEVYDVGETPAGVPYFSLEFCLGGSLDAKMGGTPLLPNEAAALVRSLALGMHSAHQANLIHRDLKPANVLLGEEGTAKVTDFGLAKRLDEASQTHTGAVFGTPSYMAPEQARGHSKEVGPAADIYALGAILYECLTGRPPFKAATVMDTLLQVMNDDPVAPRLLNAKVPRDLETIALKCLEKETAKRYSSAGELADDLGRFLQGESILARPVGPAVRTWRWARRKPTIAALSAALIVLTLAALTTITLLYRDAVHQAGLARSAETQAEKDRDTARIQRDEAEENLRLARLAVDEAFGLSRDSPLLQGDNMRSVRLMLTQKSLPFYEKIRERRSTLTDLDFETADLHFRVAYLQSEMDRNEEAVAEYTRALASFRKGAAAHPGEPAYAVGAASTCGNLGRVLTQLGRYGAAVEYLEESRKFYADLAARQPDELPHQLGLAIAAVNLGLVQRARSRHSEALASFEVARDKFALLAQARPNVPMYQHYQAVSQTNVATTLHDLGRLREAIAAYETGRQVLATLNAGHPHIPPYQKELARACSNRATLLSDLGLISEALDNYLQSRGVYRVLTVRFPEVSEYRIGLAAVCNNLGRLYEKLGRYAEAVASCEEGRGVLEELVRTEPSTPSHHGTLAIALCNEALALRGLGQLDRALEHNRRAVELFERVIGPEDAGWRDELGRCHHHIGDIYRLQDQPAEALQSYARSVAIRRALVADQLQRKRFRDGLMTVLWRLGVTQHDQGDLPAAARSLEEARTLGLALADEKPDFPAFRAEAALVTGDLARCRHQQRRHKEALALMEEARAVMARIDTAKMEPARYLTARAQVLKQHAFIQFERGLVKEALASSRQARDLGLKLTASYPGVPAHLNALGEAWGNLGVHQRMAGLFPDALKSQREAIRLGMSLVVKQPDVPGHRATLAAAHSNHANMLRDTGRGKEAHVSYDKARELYTKLIEEQPKVVAHLDRQATTCNNHALLMRSDGRAKDALALFAQTRELRQKLADRKPADPESANQLAQAWNNLGVAQSEAGVKQDARASYGKARAIQTALLKDHPELANIRHGLAQTSVNEGNWHKERGERKEAEGRYQEARKLLASLEEDFPQNREYRQQLAGVWYNLALLQYQGKDLVAAVLSLRRAESVYVAMLEQSPQDVGLRFALTQILGQLGTVLAEARRTTEARASYTRARTECRTLLTRLPDAEPVQRFLLSVLMDRAKLHGDERAAAVADLTEANKLLDRLRERHPSDAALRLTAYDLRSRRGALLDALGRYNDSLTDWTEAAWLAPKEQRVYARVGLAVALARTGQYARAADEAKELEQPDHVERDKVYNLACVYSLCGLHAAGDGARPLPERERRAEQYHRLAVRLLEQARKDGYFAPAAVIQALDDDDALIHLHSRDDYRAFRRALMPAKQGGP